MINLNLKLLLKKRLRPALSEVERLMCDTINFKTNWKPKVSFNQGLKDTITWIKNKELINSKNTGFKMFSYLINLKKYYNAYLN